VDHFRRSVPTLVERAHQVVADGTARRLADKCLDDAIQEVRDDLLATPNVRPEMMTQPAGRHPPNGASGAGRYRMVSMHQPDSATRHDRDGSAYGGLGGL